eukprot:11800507-Ditylum_brightwellii.AAC.1
MGEQGFSWEFVLEHVNSRMKQQCNQGLGIFFKGLIGTFQNFQDGQLGFGPRCLIMREVPSA